MCEHIHLLISVELNHRQASAKPALFAGRISTPNFNIAVPQGCVVYPCVVMQVASESS